MTLPLSHLRRAVVVAVSCTLPLGLAGCGQVNGSTVTPTAQLRIIDTSPDAGGVDIHANSGIIAYNLGFGTISNYFPVSPGTYTLSADAANSTTVLTSTRASLGAGQQYTYLIGNVAAGLQSQLLTDPSSPSPGNQVAVRIIDETTRIGAVDVYFLPTGTTLLNAAPIATGVSFSQIRTGISVPNGSYTIVILPAGTVPVAATATVAATVALYTSAVTALPSGSARTLVLIDTQITTTPAVQVVIADDYDSPYAM